MAVNYTITLSLEALLERLRGLTAYIGAKAPMKEPAGLPDAAQHARLAVTPFDSEPWSSSPLRASLQRAMAGIALALDHYGAVTPEVPDKPRGAVAAQVVLPDNYRMPALPALEPTLESYLLQSLLADWLETCSEYELAKPYQAQSQLALTQLQTLMHARREPRRLDRRGLTTLDNALLLCDGDTLADIALCP